MLSKIKSIYFSRIVFLNLDEKRKLKLIKYNKKMQYSLDIDLINYILFSGKYIIYESNRKGKEYWENGILLYEGDYLNGERNGSGREYFDSNIIQFVGEYRNGKRHGEGIEYYPCPNCIRCEGNYLNGEINGKQIFYNLIKIIKRYI